MRLQGLQGVTEGYKGLQPNHTRGYRSLQGVTAGYMVLQGVTKGYSEIHWVTRGYRGL